MAREKKQPQEVVPSEFTCQTLRDDLVQFSRGIRTRTATVAIIANMAECAASGSPAYGATEEERQKVVRECVKAMWVLTYHQNPYA